MTVRELIHHLQTCTNLDAVVILQKDAEGNGFSPLREFRENDPAGVDRYFAETTWSGEVYPADEAPSGGVPCITLVPVN
jgi:hypothetical protein